MGHLYASLLSRLREPCRRGGRKTLKLEVREACCKMCPLDTSGLLHSWSHNCSYLFKTHTHKINPVSIPAWVEETPHSWALDSWYQMRMETKFSSWVWLLVCCLCSRGWPYTHVNMDSPNWHLVSYKDTQKRREHKIRKGTRRMSGRSWQGEGVDRIKMQFIRTANSQRTDLYKL